MHKVKAFMAEDGTLFPDEAQCREYELEKRLRLDIEGPDAIHKNIEIKDMRAFVNFLRDNSVIIYELLQSHKIYK